MNRRRNTYSGSLALQYEAFVAPTDFNPDAQPVNIIRKFAEYENVYKRLIISIPSLPDTIELITYSYITYCWAESIAGIEYTHNAASGTAFTAGSTNRYVIMNSSYVGSVFLIIPVTSVWCYFSGSVTALSCSGCSNLKYIHAEKNNLTSIIAFMFYACRELTGELKIPNSVISIGFASFEYCYKLTGSLVIPDSVTYIDTEAFYGCYGFNGTLVLPASLTLSTNYIFYGCSGLIGNIPLNLVTGSFVFYGCSGLIGSLIINSAATSIPAGVYCGCSGLTGVLTIPTGIVSIGSGAFQGCSGFTGSLIIPQSVKTISDHAFHSLSKMTGELVLPDGLISIGGYAFEYTKFTGSLVIPNSVTAIGEEAFYLSNNFTSIELPTGISSILIYTFTNCSGIVNAKIKATTAPSVVGNGLDLGGTPRPLHVPIGAIGYDVIPYINTAIFSSVIFDL